jgi:N4-gp56 family major capsid protein
MVDSLETLAQEAIEAGATTTTVDGGAEASMTAQDVITMNKVRETVAILRGDNVAPIVGSNYAAIMHPDISYDLMTATAATDWAAFVQRSDASQWLNGQVAQAAGISFLESSRAAINVDGGAASEDIYSTYFLGQDALGKAVSIPPHIVVGPVTDKLMRFRPLGWHAYLDYGVIRALAARNLLAVSSIGAN